MVAVRADAPFKTMKDFIDAAKAKPGELKQSGGSLTARDSIMRQVLQNATGARWAFISFPGGGERIAALLGGHVNMMIIEPQEAGENIRAGKMRVLAQVADKRLPAFPDVPTLKEAGFDVPLVPQMRGAVAPPAIAAGRCRVLAGLLPPPHAHRGVAQVSRRQPVRGRLQGRRRVHEVARRDVEAAAHAAAGGRRQGRSLTRRAISR